MVFFSPAKKFYWIDWFLGRPMALFFMKPLCNVKFSQLSLIVAIMVQWRYSFWTIFDVLFAEMFVDAINYAQSSILWHHFTVICP